MRARDAIHRVVDRNVQNGERARRDRGWSSVRTDRVKRGGIPVGDNVGVRRRPSEGHDQASQCGCNSMFHSEIFRLNDYVMYCHAFFLSRANEDCKVGAG